MIDTHSHIYVKDFNDDFDEMLHRAKEVGVSQIYLPNIDKDSIADLKRIAHENPMCKPMMGLHPGSVKEDYKEQLAIILQELENPEIKYYAVGEIGIDLFWDKTFIKEQQEVFATQIKKAKEMQLPIVIHCRDAFDEVFEVLESAYDEKLFGIFHCFTGNAEQAQRAIGLNMKLGIGGVVTFKNGGLDKALTEVDVEHMVLETDTPYLAPTPFRGKRNEPAYLQYIAQKLADIKQISLAELDRITTANAESIFK